VHECVPTCVVNLPSGIVFADIDASDAGEHIFVLRNDLRIHELAPNGTLLGMIEDFANLFSDGGTVTSSDVPLLSISDGHIVVADPVTGLLGVYSLTLRRISFSQITTISAFSLAAGAGGAQVTLSCRQSGEVFRFDINSGSVMAVQSGEKHNPPMVCTNGRRTAIIDTSTAKIVLKDRGVDKRTVSFWPQGIAADSFQWPPTRYVFGIDCVWRDETMLILQGQGGTVVPSFWRIYSDFDKVESFRLLSNASPLRVAAYRGAALLLSKNAAEDYSIQFLPNLLT